MEPFLTPFSDEERAAKLENILTEHYPEWEEWLKSPVYAPFSVRNQKLIQQFLKHRNMVTVGTILNAKLFILDIMYAHIIHTLQKPETRQDYTSWFALQLRETCKSI